MKRVLVVSLCLLMLASGLVACSTPAAPTTAPATQPATTDTGTQTSAPTAAPTPAMDTSPITFTMYQSVNRPDIDIHSNSPVGNKVKELTGVTIEWQFNTAGDIMQQIGLMCASNNYPDLISADTATPLLYDAGALVKLDGLIDQYGADLKAFYTPELLKRCRWNLMDKSIYCLPTTIDDGSGVETGLGFMLQIDALKEQGYPKIKTLTDYENVIKTYLEKHPTTADGKPMIGFSLCYDSWNAIFSAYNNILFASGMAYNDGYYNIDLNTHKVTYLYKMPQVKEGYKWLNHMNAIGLIDPESFVQKFDQYSAKIAEGRVIGINDSRWHVLGPLGTLKSEGKVGQLYGYFSPTIDEKTLYGGAGRSCISPTYGISITTQCAKPDRAMQYLNWACTEEARILNSWGIEGSNYVIQDGKRVETEEMKTQRTTNPDYYKNFGIFTMLAPSTPWYMKDSTGQYFSASADPQGRYDEYTPAEKEALAGYGVKFWQDMFPDYHKDIPENTWGNGYAINFPSDSTEATIATACQDIVAKNVVNAVLAKPEEFDAVWAAFMTELEQANVQQIEQNMQVLVERKIRLYTED